MGKEMVFLVCEECGCSNLEYKEVCDCTLTICGCYAHRTDDWSDYLDDALGLTGEE